MAYGGYNYGGYPGPGGYYAPPAPDQLAQLRAGQFQQPQPMMQNQQMQPIQPAQPVPQATMTQPVVQPIPPQTPQPTISGPYYVSGDAGARGYLVAANTTVLLFDADPDANTFWLKSADAAGMPSMRTFDYVERINATKSNQEAAQAVPVQNVEYVPRADFDALAARCAEIEAELKELKDKPCKCSTSKKQKEDATND